jgi:putative flippase GtrA
MLTGNCFNNKFVRYIVSSGLSFILDIFLFYLFNKFIFSSISETIIVSTFSARILSSVFNFLVNNTVVFKQKLKLSFALKYFVLWLFVLSASALLVRLFDVIVNIETVFIKLPVDVLLFLGSYIIQKNHIFKSE